MNFGSCKHIDPQSWDPYSSEAQGPLHPVGPHHCEQFPPRLSCQKIGPIHGTRKTGIGMITSGIKAKNHGINQRHGIPKKFQPPRFEHHRNGKLHPPCMMMSCYTVISFTRQSSQRPGVGERTYVVLIHSPFPLDFSHVMGHQSLVWDCSQRDGFSGSSQLAPLRKVFLEHNSWKQETKGLTLTLCQNTSIVPQIQMLPSPVSQRIQPVSCPLWFMLLFQKWRKSVPPNKILKPFVSCKMYRKSWKKRKKSSVNHKGVKELPPSLKSILLLMFMLLVPKKLKKIPLNLLMKNTPQRLLPENGEHHSISIGGASPKAKTQRGLDSWVRRPEQSPPQKTPLTAEEVMNPSKPVLRDQQPKSGSQGDLKKWMEQFDVETQQTAKKMLEMLADHKYSKAKLQNAAAQYGLNVQDSLKYQPKSLQQVIAYAAAMSSWLALAHHHFAPHEVLSDIKILRALIRVIHHVPAIQKNIAMWAFGLLHLVALFGYPSAATVTTIWQRRLSSIGISLETYTFAFFSHACTVYIKLPFYWTFQSMSDKIVYHHHGRFYIGSTSITAAKRDFNRMAKMKQTLSDSAVHVELAIRYWASQPSDFYQFSTIVLRSTTLYQDAWTYEHLLISKWQAPLNFPFITEILKLKAKGWQLQYRRHNQQFPRVHS